MKSLNGGGRYAFNADAMGELLTYDSIAYGMGMGVSEEVAKGAAWLIENFEGALILDADGLNSLARYGKEGLACLFRAKKCDVLLTPHLKEFSRLAEIAVEEALKGGFAEPTALAREFGVNILLKNATSVMTDGARCTVNAAGCSGQAKGGSGDVLSGVIAGLCAMGLTSYEGGVAGAYLTGKAAELAEKALGEYSLTATDVIAYLGKAFLQLKDDHS